MIRIVYLFLTFITMQVVAQENPRTLLKGKLSADFSTMEDVSIINKQTEKSSISDADGNFKIQATVRDTLLFSKAEFREMRVILTLKDFEQDILVVKMKPVINQLDEVVVQNGINAVSMGIIPKGQRVYTPAERRLNTATNLNASLNAGTMMGGSVSADPLLNWISGRTKMLKKGVAVEKKEFYLTQLENMFSDDYLISKLKIPAEYVKGFTYYVVENEQLVSNLKMKNKSMTAFLLGELAIKYKEIIASEN